MKPTESPTDPARRDPVAEFKQKAQAEKMKRLQWQLAIGLLMVLALIAAGKMLLPLGGENQEESEVESQVVVIYGDTKIVKTAQGDPSNVEDGLGEADSESGQEKRASDAASARLDSAVTGSATDKQTTAAEKLAGEEALILEGIDSTREQSVQRDEEILSRVFEDGTWTAYRSLLQKSIQAALPEIAEGSGLNRFDALLNEPALYRAFLRWSVLGWLPESEIRALQIDSYSGKFLKWMLTNNEAMEEFLLVIRPEDDSSKVLEFLMDVWNVNEEKYAEYFSLALACAVVFDQTVRIPHPIGASDSEGDERVDPLRRYLWYVENNEKGRLEGPVNRMSARDLVWVVCAPISTSEMEWAIRKVRLRRKTWGQAYGMVEYLMERAVEGVNPYEEYSFEEILKEGGICGDQSYFCANTARVNGIPALILTGTTSGGPHAWVGLQVDDGEWTTGVGRIGGVSKGETTNPQTGERLTEQEILLWNDRTHQSAVVSLNVWRLLWLEKFFKALELPAERSAAIRISNRIGRSFPETWQALYGLLEDQTEMIGDPKKPSNLEEWKSFAADMRREFLENPRIAGLASDAEMKYIFPYGSAGDAKRSFIRERRRIERESAEQMDLIAESLRREAELIFKRGDPDAEREIMQLYDSALRDYGTDITGFRMMAKDYFGYFEKDKAAAKKAARDIELAYKRVVESATTEWFRAQTEASILTMICDFYRKAGEPDRAEYLERRNEVRMRRAKRDAD